MKRFILAILIIAVVLVIVALATGFMSLRTEGELRAPTVDINATGGALPEVQLDTKQVVVGTTDANIAAPGIGSRQVEVPVIGIRDGGAAAGNAGGNAAANAQ